MNMWAVPITVLVAISGYLFTYLHQRHVSSKRAQLERVNSQLRDLYGPLYASLRANQSVWKAFTENYWPEHGEDGFFGDGTNTSDKEKETWRIWVIEVFEPLNARIEKSILENGDLLQDGEFPEVFVKALAHIAAYRAVYQRWREGDFSEHTSVCNFPDLLSEIAPKYHALLDEQRRLTGAT